MIHAHIVDEQTGREIFAHIGGNSALAFRFPAVEAVAWAALGAWLGKSPGAADGIVKYQVPFIIEIEDNSNGNGIRQDEIRGLVKKEWKFNKH